MKRSALTVVALTAALCLPAAGAVASGNAKAAECARKPDGSSFAVYPTVVGCVRLKNPGTRVYREIDLTLMIKTPKDPIPWPVLLRTGLTPGPSPLGWLLNEKAARWKTWFLVAWPYVYVSSIVDDGTARPPGEGFRSMVWRLSRSPRGGWRARLVHVHR